MGIVNLFSKRQKLEEGISDIYTYDEIPRKLRNQIIFIMEDCIGKYKALPKQIARDLPSEIYKSIYNTLKREYGKTSLVVYDGYFPMSPKEQVIEFLRQTENVNEILDVVELSFQKILIINDYENYSYYTEVTQSAEDGIKELNERFKENGVGYSFESGKIIRVDSTIIHSEITKKTLQLLSDEKFQGANNEYLKAHEHYRNGDNKAALNECLKAFESVLKIICKEKQWDFKETDTARQLIQICFNKELVPTYVQNQFTSLQNLVETGIAPIRNKSSAHGQGSFRNEVSNEITKYGLNLTGVNILFLVDQAKIT
jgi:hypothetical protein